MEKTRKTAAWRTSEPPNGRVLRTYMDTSPVSASVGWPRLAEARPEPQTRKRSELEYPAIRRSRHDKIGGGLSDALPATSM
jgi:hypothetical protein